VTGEAPGFPSAPAAAPSPLPHAPTSPSALEKAARPPLPRLVKALPVVATCCLLLSLGTLGTAFLYARAQVVPLLAAVGTLFAAGKEAGIPTGIAAGGNPWLVGWFLFVTDSAAVLFAYPFIHMAFDGVKQSRRGFGSFVRSAQMRADKHRKKIDRYGPWGLFTYLIIPFAFNSPLLGIAVGRVTGLRPGQIVTAVFGAIATTALGWTVLYSFVFREELKWPWWLPLSFSLLVTALAFTLGFVSHRKEKKRLAAAEAAGQIPPEPK
jgi:hypothetical protein